MASIAIRTSRRRRRAHTRSVIFAVAIVAIASSEAVGSSGFDPAETTDINPRPREELSAGGTLRLPVSSFGPNWNRATAQGSAAHVGAVLAPMSYTPWVFDASGHASLDPDYVTGFAETGDHLVHTYTLNPDAHWHSGEPVTAADWVADWHARNGTDAAFAAVSTEGYELIASVAAGTDEFEVVVTYEVPYPDFQRLFFLQGPGESVADPEMFNSGWSGAPRDEWFTGPFRIGSFDDAAGVLELVADETWWGDAPILGSIRFIRHRDPGSVAAAFAAGDLDAYDIGADAAAYAAAVGMPGAEVRAAAGPSSRQITMNSGPGGGLLQEQPVRQAIQLGLDRAAIAASDLSGIPWPAQPLGNHIVVGNSPHYADNSAEWGSRDVDRARRILESDGWVLGDDGFYDRDGQRLSVAFTEPAGAPEAHHEAGLVRAQLAAVGIDVTTTVVPTETWGTLLAAGGIELTAFTWVGTPFPFAGVDQRFGDGSPGNFGHSTVAGLDPLLTALSTTWEPSDRATIANEIDVLLWEFGHTIPLYQHPELIAARSDLANFGAFGYRSIEWEDVGFAESSAAWNGEGSR